MASIKPELTAIRSFADHEVITPPNKLQGAVGRAVDGDDPVARAEAALAQLSSEFTDWMHDECEQLDGARRNVRQNGLTALPREALFRAAHDIKGQAATLGFPLVAEVAGSLCRLIEEAHDPRSIPLDLIDQHVDAVRAIIREHSLPNAEAIAERLTDTLRQVCEDFLARQAPQESGAGG
jgi:HPt (histidine-containing phosphotransfer) domain-containing protein